MSNAVKVSGIGSELQSCQLLLQFAYITGKHLKVGRVCTVLRANRTLAVTSPMVARSCQFCTLTSCSGHVPKHLINAGAIARSGMQLLPKAAALRRVVGSSGFRSHLLCSAIYVHRAFWKGVMGCGSSAVCLLLPMPLLSTSGQRRRRHKQRDARAKARRQGERGNCWK